MKNCWELPLGVLVNEKCPGGPSVGDPTGIQLVNGIERLVVDNTVNEPPGALVNPSCNIPLPSICAWTIGGDTVCVMVIAWPNTVM